MKTKLAYLPLLYVACASTVWIAPRPASAQQDYPTKPIRLVIGVAPGGATDILARAVGTKLGENLNQPPRRATAFRLSFDSGVGPVYPGGQAAGARGDHGATRNRAPGRSCDSGGGCSGL